MQPPQPPPPGSGPTPGYGPPPAYPPAPGYPSAPGYPGAGPYPAPPRPPALSPAGQPLASFGDRLLAYLIDTAIFMGVALVVAVPVLLIPLFVFLPELGNDVNPDGTYADPPWEFFAALLIAQGVLFLLLIGFYYLYYVEYQLRRGGRTVGKKVMKIQVVPLDPAGTLSRGMLAKRWLVQIVAGTFVPFFSYLDGFWQLWDKPFQQCLHDKFAQTVVVKVNG